MSNLFDQFSEEEDEEPLNAIMAPTSKGCNRIRTQENQRRELTPKQVLFQPWESFHSLKRLTKEKLFQKIENIKILKKTKKISLENSNKQNNAVTDQFLSTVRLSRNSVKYEKSYRKEKIKTEESKQENHQIPEFEAIHLGQFIRYDKIRKKNCNPTNRRESGLTIYYCMSNISNTFFKRQPSQNPKKAEKSSQIIQKTVHLRETNLQKILKIRDNIRRRNTFQFKKEMDELAQKRRESFGTQPKSEKQIKILSQFGSSVTNKTALMTRKSKETSRKYLKTPAQNHRQFVKVEDRALILTRPLAYKKYLQGKQRLFSGKGLKTSLKISKQEFTFQSQ